MEKEGISIEQEKNIVKEVMNPISIYVIINVIASIMFVDLNAVFVLLTINFFIGLINDFAMSVKKAREDLDKAKSRINTYILGRFAFILWIFLIPISEIGMGARCACGYRMIHNKPLNLYFIVYILTMIIYILIMKSGKNKIVKIDKLFLITIVIAFLLTASVYMYNETFPDSHSRGRIF